MYPVLVLTLLFAMIVMVAIGKPEREWIGLILITTLLATGAVSIIEGINYVNWDVLGLILGMSIFSVLMEESGIAEYIADMLLSRIKSPFILFYTVILSAGIVSIALENVTVVLLYAPIVFNIVKKTSSDPAPFIVGIALSSNMAGSATMIGDPPAIITAGHYDLKFTDFIFYKGKPSMFFITLIPMIISCLTYTIITLRSNQKINPVQNNAEIGVRKYDRAYMAETLLFLSVKITLLSIRDIIHIPLSLAALVGVGGLILTRIIVHKDYSSVKTSIKKGFEWKLLVFLIGVFILSGSFAKYGLADETAKGLLGLAGGNLFILTGILIWFSVAVSAVIDNTPYVVTMLPVIDDLAANTGVEPIVYAWALLLGATLGGGITYIGASANLVAVRLLEKRGRRITFIEFIKRSIPFNIVNILAGWLLFIVFWL